MRQNSAAQGVVKAVAIFIMTVAAGQFRVGRTPVGVNATALPSSLAGVTFLYAPAQVVTLQQGTGEAQVVGRGAIFAAVKGVVGIDRIR